MANEYIPFLSKIKEIVKHTETEYTFRMTYVGDVRPGQFFEVSIPKYGEAPISVSGIGEDYVDLTIRKVGKVTGEIFELNEGSSFFMRGPYGNGFEKENYQGKELIVVAGGTGVSPVRGVISYFGEHQNEVKKLHTILTNHLKIRKVYGHGLVDHLDPAAVSVHDRFHLRRHRRNGRNKRIIAATLGFWLLR